MEDVLTDWGEDRGGDGDEVLIADDEGAPTGGVDRVLTADDVVLTAEDEGAPTGGVDKVEGDGEGVKTEELDGIQTDEEQ